MTSLAPPASPPGGATPAGDLAVSVGAHLLLLAAGVGWAGFPLSWAGTSILLHGGLAWLLLRRGARRFPGPGLGWANRITLGRAVPALPLAALALHPEAVTTPVLWAVVVTGTMILVLDGLDGRVARSTGTETALGARFDMELDAFVLLSLSGIAWLSGPVGGALGPWVASWVLLLGGMRYLFVLAARFEPRLREPLPESPRRKTVCVVQGVALLVAVGPIVPTSLAVGGLAVALGLLAWSFAVDVRWLLAREPALSRGSGRGSRSAGDGGRPSPGPGPPGPGWSGGRGPRGWDPGCSASGPGGGPVPPGSPREGGSTRMS
ncbi:MAG: CDP-alcohol phosphatidyltransferase family protein [Gemmatimonadales bacterium]|nr:MAG: CDP-alcohol phosphatidyltransferase family protein [Gemmatimonadales bacterium]